MATEEIKIARLRLKLEGEHEFQAALNDSNHALALSQKQFATYSEQQKLSGNTVEVLRQKESLLSDQHAAQAEKLRQLKAIQEEVNNQYGEDSKEARRMHLEVLDGEKKLAAYENQLEQVRKELKDQESGYLKAAEKLEAFGNKANAVGEKLTNVGTTLTKTVTAPLLAIGTLATKSAMDFETAMTGVRKTTDLTDEEFAEFGDTLRAMSLEMPVSASELANLAESAGQLGIKKENLLSFTRVMADMAIATNIAGSEGASNMARFANIMNMSQKDFDRMGSTIVELGNNSATTEREILDMAMRLAGAGSQAKMSEADVLGISAALSSLGIESQAGGSAFSKAINRIQLAVDTGSDDLDKFAEVAGMSADAFKRAWEEDAASALTKFIVGLGNAEATGRTTNEILQDLGMTEVRLGDAFRRTSGASDLFKTSLEMANGAWKENNALTKESDLFKGTAASQLEIAKNKMNDVAITIGNQLVPHVTNLVEWLSELVAGFNRLSPGTQETIVRFAAIAAAVGPILTTFGKLTSTVGSITASFGKLKDKVSGTGGLLSALTGTAGLVGGLAVVAGATAYFALKADDATRTVDRFDKAIKNAETNLEAQHRASEVAAGSALYLSGMIEELAGKENKSAAEKKLLIQYINQLNEIMPDLNLSYDENTSSLNLSTSAIRDNIDAMIDAAKAAAQMEYLNKLIAAHVELEMDRADMAERQADALSNLAANEQRHLEYQKALNEATTDAELMSVLNEYGDIIKWVNDLQYATNAISVFDRRLVESQSEIDRYADRFGKSGEKIVESAQQTTSSVQSYEQERLENAAFVTAGLSTEYDAQLGHMEYLGQQAGKYLKNLNSEEQKKIDERLEHLDTRNRRMKQIEDERKAKQIAAEEEIEKNTQAHWDKIFSIDSEGIAKKGTTLADATANLQKQIEAYRNWQTNIQLLAAKVPPSVLAELEKLGPAQATLIQGLVDATPEELQAFIEAWQTAGQIASEEATKELGKTIQGAKNTAAAVVKSWSDRKAAMKSAGWALGNEGKKGLQDGSAGSADVGTNMADGIALRLKLKEAAVALAGRNMVKTAISAMKSQAMIYSPSKATAEIGEYMALGLEYALRDNTKSVASQAEKMVSATLAELKPLEDPMSDIKWSDPTDYSVVGIDPVAIAALTAMQPASNVSAPITLNISVDSVRSDQDITAISDAVQKAIYDSEMRQRRSLSNVY